MDQRVVALGWWRASIPAELDAGTRGGNRRAVLAFVDLVWMFGRAARLSDEYRAVTRSAAKGDDDAASGKSGT